MRVNFLGFLIIIILAGVGWYTLSHPALALRDHVENPPPTSNTVSQQETGFSDTAWPRLKSAIEIVRVGLWDAKESGFVTADDFEKLNFSSGDIAHGWNPKYETGTDKNQKTYFVVGENLELPLKEEIQSLVMQDRPANPFVVMRRYKYTKRGDMDFLYLVIPYIDESKCGRNVTEKSGIEISRDKIMVDEKVLEGCVRMHDATINLFLPIIYRLRISQTDKWDMEPRFKALPSSGFHPPTKN